MPATLRASKGDPMTSPPAAPETPVAPPAPGVSVPTAFSSSRSEPAAETLAPPKGPTRTRRPALLAWFFRVPIGLYRVGLADQLGRSTLLLTTRGRKTGRWRTTALNYLVEGDVLYVVSGMGPRSDWLRNLQADPQVQVQSADDPSTPVLNRSSIPPNIGAFCACGPTEAYARRRLPPCIVCCVELASTTTPLTLRRACRQIWHRSHTCPPHASCSLAFVSASDRDRVIGISARCVCGFRSSPAAPSGPGRRGGVGHQRRETPSWLLGHGEGEAQGGNFVARVIVGV